MTATGLGDQEVALLRFVAERGDATVREAVEGFGEPRGLARSTVLTMMDRLRRKGRLRRRRVDGVFRYRPTEEAGTTLRGLVDAFVENTLGGSVVPFVQYLTESERMTAEEIAELERLLDGLKSRTKGR